MTQGSKARLRVVVCAPHPDDECLIAGGLCSLLSRPGIPVHVLAFSAGEAGGCPSVRRAEFESACRRLSAHPQWVALWPDGAFAETASVQRRLQLAAVLDTYAAGDGPCLVVTWGPGGGYGHPDHVTLLEDVVAWASAHPCVALLVRDDPAQVYAPVRRWLRRRALPRLVLRDPLPWRRVCASVTVDVAEVVDVRREALACHASQLPRGGVDAFLGAVLHRIGTVERFLGDAAALTLLRAAGVPFTSSPEMDPACEFST